MQPEPCEGQVRRLPGAVCGSLRAEMSSERCGTGRDERWTGLRNRETPVLQLPCLCVGGGGLLSLGFLACYLF